MARTSKTSRATDASKPRIRRDPRLRLPDDVMALMALHAHSLPFEACGIVIWEDATARAYIPADNALASTRAFRLVLADEVWEHLLDLEVESKRRRLGLFHSHVYGGAKPTDADAAGLDSNWRGRPYVIFSVRAGDWWVGRIG